MPVDVPIIRVWPSGSAFMTAIAAITLEAPGLFSIRNGLPSRGSRCFAASRPRKSVPPPGANGTTTVIGLEG